MSFFSRVAIAAAMTLSLAGLVANSSPGLAAELDPMLIPAPIATPAPVAVDPILLPAPSADLAVAQPDDEIAYPTLAAAVAAQDAAQSDDTMSDDAIRCLAGAIYYESKGEPLAGQLAVAHVVINRSKSGRFPADVCSVVTQRGQFSFVRGGRIPAIDEGRSAWRTAVAVAKVAFADAWDSPAPRALYFNTPNRMPGTGLKKIAAIGNHVFYR